MGDLRRSIDQVAVPEPREALNRFARLAAWLRIYWSQPEHQVLWCIVALAAILRLVSLDLVEFRPEQIAQLSAADCVTRLRLPLLGFRLVDAPDAPSLLTYIIALPLSIRRDPRLAAALVATLHVIAVGWSYGLTRRHYGTRVAIVAASLFAVTPWAVVFSRRISTDALVPLLNVWLLGGLLSALADRRPQAWLAVGVALALLAYSSPAFYPLIVVVVALAIVYRQRIPRDWFIAGALLAAVVVSPYIMHQAARGFPDLARVIDTVWAMAASGLRLRALIYGAWAHSGHFIAGLAAPSTHEYHLQTLIFDGFTRLMGGLFLLSLPTAVALALRAWGRWRTRADTAPYTILALWVWLPWLLLPGTPERLGPHTLTVLYPAGFIAMGLLVDRALAALDATRSRWSHAPLIGHMAVWGIIWCYVVLSCFATITLYRFVETHDTALGYGTPYRFWRRTAGLVQREAHSAGADQVWALPAEPESVAALHYLLEPYIPSLFVIEGRPEMLPLPVERPALYMVSRSSPRSELTMDWLDARDVGVALFPGDVPPVTVVTTDAFRAEEMLGAVATSGLWMLDAGVWLVGYEWPADAAPGQDVVMATYWTFIDIPSGERDVSHELVLDLIAPDGERVAQATGFGLPEEHWVEGLVIKQWHSLQIPQDAPEGSYTLLVGMYRLSDGLWSRHIDDQGFDLGPAIEIGPLRTGRTLTQPLVGEIEAPQAGRPTGAR
jgi:hypothetical protein